MRSPGLGEIGLASALLLLTTLALVTVMTSSAARDGQSRERAWARIRAQEQLERMTRLRGRELIAQYRTPRDFAVGCDANGDGVLAHAERLIPAPPPGEVPARGEAGRAAIDLSYPGIARAVVSVRWCSPEGEQELLLAAQLAVDGGP